MSKRKEEDFLKDILEASKRILSYTEGLEYQDFAKDLKTQDAVVRNLEIIGEAVKNLSDDFRKTYSEIPWKNIAGMRDKLIHDYFGVNIDIVWGVAREDLPDWLAGFYRSRNKVTENLFVLKNLHIKMLARLQRAQRKQRNSLF